MTMLRTQSVQGQRSRFPPLDVGITGLGIGPTTAPDVRRTLEENRNLREENEVLKRELVDRLRGNNNKFVGGGHFRAASAPSRDQKCTSCILSKQNAQKEARQRLQVQQLYDEERQTTEMLQRALREAEDRLNESPEPPEVIEVMKEVQVEVPVEVVPQEIKVEVERLRRDSDHWEQDKSDLERQLALEGLVLVRSQPSHFDRRRQQNLGTAEMEHMDCALSGKKESATQSEEKERSTSLGKNLESIKSLMYRKDQTITASKSKIDQLQQDCDELKRALDAARSEKDAAALSLADTSAELEALRSSLHASMSERDQELEMMEERAQHNQQVAVDHIKKLERELAEVTNEHQSALAKSERLEGECTRLEEENSELERKLKLAQKEAMKTDKLEDEVESLKQTVKDLEAKSSKDAKEMAALKTSLAESATMVRPIQLSAPKQAKQLSNAEEELNALQIEKAAYSAQQESMVQLVVVAPSVNVSLGADFANNACTHDMKVVHEKVGTTINKDVMPSFLKVFISKLPTGMSQGSLPPGYVDQLIADMQISIANHLEPVLENAWGNNK